jgi:hypothetical protein
MLAAENSSMSNILQENEKSGRLKTVVGKTLFWLLCSLAASGATVIILCVVVLRHLEWHDSLLHFLSRSWQSFVSSMSTNTLGFIMTSILIPVIGSAAVLGGLFWFKRREDFWQALRESLVVGAFVTVAMLCLWSAMFGWNVVRIVYDDHSELVGSKTKLDSANSKLSKEIERLTSENGALKKQPQSHPTVITKVVQPQDMPLSISIKEYGGWPAGQGKTVYFILGMTNKTISPVLVTMTCDEDFERFGPGLLSARGESNVQVMGLNQQQVDNRTFKYFRLSPAWTPESPLGFGVITESKGIACKIYQNP